MKPQLQLIDPSFQSQNSEKCDLLLHIGAAGISYAIVNREENKLKVLCEVSLAGYSEEKTVNNLVELTDKNDHFKFSYKKVIISVETFKYTFIPNEVYDKSKLLKYAKFLNPDRFDDILVSDLKQPAIKNIFSIDVDIKTYLLAQFPNAIIVNQANPLICGSQKALGADSSSHLFINIQTCNFEIAFYTANKLHLYNMYEYKNVDEFNYFLLAIINMFQLSGSSTTVVLAGKINPGEELYLRIKKYFTKIKLADSAPLADRDYVFHRVQSHTFFSLLSLTLCE